MGLQSRDWNEEEQWASAPANSKATNTPCLIRYGFIVMSETNPPIPPNRPTTPYKHTPETPSP